MSFRFYPSNPVLQRLRESGDIKVTPKTTSPPSSPIIFSGYGELSSPQPSPPSNSCNVRSKRRRSSASSQIASPDIIPKHIGNPMNQEVPQSQPPTAPKESVEQTGKSFLTSRPVFVREPSPDDAMNAVVLRARFEKLVHATPRKIFLRPKVSSRV